jgi:FKBP-type peptidyl-prolyl cis-trans isomerase FkpA
MRKASYLWICVALLAFSCASSEKETKSGFKYTVVKAGSGDGAKKEEIVVFNYELRDNKDSLWNDSYESKFPAAIQVPDTAKLGRPVDPITEMISELKAGDSVKATLTVKEFFTKLVGAPSVPPGVDTTRSVTYRINVVDIMSLNEFVAWRKDAVSKRDDKLITDYLSKNNIQAEKDTSGFYFVMHNNGGGAKPTAQNCVEVKYAGKFLSNGQVFDQNAKVAFSLEQVITGWQYGIPKLSKGDSATFYIPSRLAYGDRGFYSIPPDAVLIFDVTLFDFKDSFDPATRTCK